MTYIAMQVIPLLHAPQVDTYKLTVSYMISTLSWGEFLAVEHHRESMLGQLSTYSNNRCISGYIKGCSKSGGANTGAIVSFYLSSSNACQ